MGAESELERLFQTEPEQWATRRESAVNEFQKQMGLWGDYSKLALEDLSEPVYRGALDQTQRFDAETGAIGKRAKELTFADPAIMGKAALLNKSGRREEARQLYTTARNARYRELFDEEAKRRAAVLMGKVQPWQDIRKEDIPPALEAGILSPPQATRLTSEQGARVAAQQIYKPTREQAVADVMENLTPEEVAQLVAGTIDLEPKIAARMQIEQFGPPRKEGGLMTAIAAPGRAISGALGGVGRTLLEAQREAPAPDVSGLAEALPPSGKLLGTAVGPLGDVARAATSGRLEVAGINPVEALKSIAKDPALLARAYKAGLEGMAANVTGESTAAGAEGLFAEARARNIDRAKRSVLDDPAMRGKSRAEALAEVDRRAELLNRTDQLQMGMGDPMWGGLGVETVLDPSALVAGPALKAIGAGAKAVGKAVPALQTLKRTFVAGAELEPLDKGVAQELMAARSAGTSQILERQEMLRQVKKAAKLVAPEERELLSDALMGAEGAAEKLSPRGQQALATFQKFPEMGQRLREMAPGAHQRIGGKGVVEMGVRQDYRHPEILRAVEGVAEPGLAKTVTVTGKIGVAQERALGKGYLKDPAAQWETALRDMIRKEPIAKEVAATDQILATHGLRAGSADEARTIGEATGIKLVKLSDVSPEVNERYLTMTAKAGESVANKEAWVPEQWLKRAEQLFPPTKVGREDDKAQVIKGFQDYVTKPVAGMWRTLTTAPNPAYHVKNIVQNQMLIGNALGAKAMDPGLHVAAGTGAMMLLAGKSKFGQKLAQKFPDLAEKVKLALDAGVVGQAGLRFGLQAESKSPVLRGVQTALKPVYKFAEFQDDYMHLMAFLGELRGTSKAQVAAAADFAAKTTGAYNRMSDADKVVKDLFGFYSWNRFYLPRVAKSLVEHPQRLAMWERIRRERDQRYATKNPNALVTARGVPRWQKMRGAYTSPVQPKPRAGESQPDAVVLRVMETPLSGLNQAVGDPLHFLGNNLGLTTKVIVESLTGRDMFTGKAIPGLDNMLKKAGMDIVGRPTRTVMDLYKYLIESGHYDEAVSLALRLRVGNELSVTKLGAADYVVVPEETQKYRVRDVMGATQAEVGFKREQQRKYGTQE